MGFCHGEISAAGFPDNDGGSLTLLLKYGKVVAQTWESEELDVRRHSSKSSNFGSRSKSHYIF